MQKPKVCVIVVHSNVYCEICHDGKITSFWHYVVCINSRNGSRNSRISGCIVLYHFSIAKFLYFSDKAQLQLRFQRFEVYKLIWKIFW